MHYGGMIRRAQTTGSCISHLALPNPENPSLCEKSILDTHWVTNTSAPCISAFKPIIGIDSLPQQLISGSTVSQHFSPTSFWWIGEQLHRLVLLDYPNRAPLLRANYKQLELSALGDVARFTNRPQESQSELNTLRKEITLKYFKDCYSLMLQLTELFREKSVRKTWRLGTSLTLLYYWNWSRLNKSSFMQYNFWPGRIVPVDLILTIITGFLLYKKRR